MTMTYRPIGVVHSPWTSREGMPIQPSRSDGARGWIEVFSEYADGLADLEGFSHIVLLSHLHASTGFKLRVVPFLDTVERGLFATRAPRRPNPIGLSVLRLLEVCDARLDVADLDMLDGTPVLDIKPYVGEFDLRHETRFGWLEQARRRDVRSDRRFADEPEPQT